MEQCPKCGILFSDGPDPVECPACGVANPAREASRSFTIVVGLLAFLAGATLVVSAVVEYWATTRGSSETIAFQLLLLVAGVALALKGLEYTFARSTLAVRAPRRPTIAAGLTLFVSGLGQLYGGEPKRALGVFFGSVGLALGLLVCRVPRTFVGLFLSIFLALSYLLWAMWDADRIASRKKDYVLRPYNRWYLYLAVIMVFGFLSNRLLVFSPIRTFRVPGVSMEPTIYPEDHVTADMTCYRSAKPDRGDVVVFTPFNDPAGLKIARVIGLEGEQIEVRNAEVYIDGEGPDPWSWGDPGFAFFPDRSLKVPAGTVFVLSDNRQTLVDGQAFGSIPLSSLRGCLLYIYWASDKGRIGISLR